MACIEPGMAVRHRTRSDIMMGRVQRLLNGRALVVWVRRRQPSYAHLENLEPIPDAELAAFFRQQEAMYDRIRDAQIADGDTLALPSRTSDEHRRFLIGGAS
jgi:hypothetical protein